MNEYIVSFEGELGIALAVACSSAGFACEKIVRCRDCIYAIGDATYCTERRTDEYATIEPDGFCKWGERKSE